MQNQLKIPAVKPVTVSYIPLQPRRFYIYTETPDDWSRAQVFETNYGTGQRLPATKGCYGPFKTEKAAQEALKRVFRELFDTELDDRDRRLCSRIGMLKREGGTVSGGVFKLVGSRLSTS